MIEFVKKEKENLQTIIRAYGVMEEPFYKRRLCMEELISTIAGTTSETGLCQQDSGRLELENLLKQMNERQLKQAIRFISVLPESEDIP